MTGLNQKSPQTKVTFSSEEVGIIRGNQEQSSSIIRGEVQDEVDTSIEEDSPRETRESDSIIRGHEASSIIRSERDESEETIIRGDAQSELVDNEEIIRGENPADLVDDETSEIIRQSRQARSSIIRGPKLIIRGERSK